jgi:hypothetical protein
MSSSADRAYLIDQPILAAKIPPRSRGAYVLGKYVGGEFSPLYVGRSDSCLLTRILTHNYRNLATHVAWRIRSSQRDAFHQECALYHTYEEEPWFLNKVHPASPKGSGLICPFCSYSIEEIDVFAETTDSTPLMAGLDLEMR